MISILDLYSREWGQTDTDLDYEWQVLCTGWHPDSRNVYDRYPETSVAISTEHHWVSMPESLLGEDLDGFLNRMSGQ